MTKEKAIDIIKCLAWHTRPNEEDIEQAIKTLEQEPTKNDLSSSLEKNSKKLEKDFGELDCISRAQTQTEIEMNASRYTIAKERGGMGQVEWSDQLIKVSDAVDIIRHLPSVTPQEPKWIPVSERLPEERLGVLVWCPTRKNIYCACYEEKQWWIFGAYWEKVTEEIVAWRPLPTKPYSEVEESEDT